MLVTDVRQLIASDRWTSVRGDMAGGSYLLRFRQPVLKPAAVADYPRCLRVVWAYGPEGSGTLPSPQVNQRMGVFEDRLCEAWEHDAVAALTAVLTFDGARQWVFYTADVGACGTRLEDMPQEAEPYPIELDAFDDPAWEYLRNEIIRNREDA